MSERNPLYHVKPGGPLQAIRAKMQSMREECDIMQDQLHEKDKELRDIQAKEMEVCLNGSYTPRLRHLV